MAEGPVRLSGQLAFLGRRGLATRHGSFELLVAQDLARGRYALALSHGDLSGGEPVLARVHSSCVTSESYGGCDCDCVEQLELAIEAIAERGRGVVFYLMQEGRGAGFLAKVRDRMIVQASENRTSTFEAYDQMGIARDLRSYEEVGWLARLLGIEAPLELLTNNPEKAAGVAASSGISVATTAKLDGVASPWNCAYLSAKSRSGHGLDDPSSLDGAALPEPVVEFVPYRLPDAPRFLSVASYFLPVRNATSHSADWFQLHAFFDLVGSREFVLLEYDAGSEAEALVRLCPETLLERFSHTDHGAPGGWAEEVVAAGAGVVGFVATAGFDAGLNEVAGDPQPLVDLLALHLEGRRVRIGDRSLRPGESVRESLLAAHGAEG